MQVYYRVGSQRMFRKGWTMVDAPMALVVQAPEVIKFRSQLAAENRVPLDSVDVAIADGSGNVCFISTRYSMLEMRKNPEYWDQLSRMLKASELRLRNQINFNEDGFDQPMFMQGWCDLPDSVRNKYVGVDQVLAGLAA